MRLEGPSKTSIPQAPRKEAFEAPCPSKSGYPSEPKPAVTLDAQRLPRTPQAMQPCSRTAFTFTKSTSFLRGFIAYPQPLSTHPLHPYTTHDVFVFGGREENLVRTTTFARARLDSVLRSARERVQLATYSLDLASVYSYEKTANFIVLFGSLVRSGPAHRLLPFRVLVPEKQSRCPPNPNLHSLSRCSRGD